jgi:hypothetical protein
MREKVDGWQNPSQLLNRLTMVGLIYEGRGGWLAEPIATVKGGGRMAAACAAVYLLLM